MKYPLLSGMDLSVVRGPLSYVGYMLRKVQRRLLSKRNPKRVEVSLGDYMLRRGDISQIQAGVAALFLDTERYINNKDDSFYYQNVSKKYWYGSDYDTTSDDLRFKGTIDSIIAKGFDPDSVVDIDKDCTLQNGTHRTAALLCLHKYQVGALVFAYRWHWFKNADEYFKQMGYDERYIDDIKTSFDRVESELISVGATFVLWLPNNQFNTIEELFKKNDIRLLAVHSDELIQFAFVSPKYIVKNNTIVSKSAEGLERQLRKKQLKGFKLSKNCLEGMDIFNEYKNQRLSK